MTDKTQGEFHKRLENLVHCESGFNKIYYESAYDLVEEAKAEFHDAVFADHVWEDRVKNVMELFKKWFGEVES